MCSGRPTCSRSCCYCCDAIIDSSSTTQHTPFRGPPCPLASPGSCQRCRGFARVIRRVAPGADGRGPCSFSQIWRRTGLRQGYRHSRRLWTLSRTPGNGKRQDMRRMRRCRKTFCCPQGIQFFPLLFPSVVWFCEVCYPWPDHHRWLKGRLNVRGLNHRKAILVAGV